MAIGLAVLTAYGSTTIDRLSAEIYATPDAYLAYIPETLRDRPLRDPLVVEALESWASREAASIMVGLFVVAAVVTVAAVLPALALGGTTGRRTARADPTALAGGPAYAGRRWQPRPRRHPLIAPPAGPVSRSPAGAPRWSRTDRAPSRVIAMVGGQERGMGGRARPSPSSRSCCARPDATVWVDLGGPSAGAGRAGRRAPGAPPADRRGHPRGQPAREGRADRGRRPHRAVRARIRRRRSSSPRSTSCSARGSCSPRTIGRGIRARRTTCAAGVGPVLSQGPDHLLWAICDDVDRQLLPVRGPARRCDRRRAGRGRPDGQPRCAGAAVRAEARARSRCAGHVGPVREIFNQLTNRETPLIDPEEVIYFRDVYDHVIRLTDELDNYRELAAATLDVYLTQVNNNLSVIMKRLTGVTVILAGIGAVAGIFGMSEAGPTLGGFWPVTGWPSLAAVVAARCTCGGSTGSDAHRLAPEPVRRRRLAGPGFGLRVGVRHRVGGLDGQRHRDDLGLADRALGALGGLQPELFGLRARARRRGSSARAGPRRSRTGTAGRRSSRPRRWRPSAGRPSS